MSQTFDAATINTAVTTPSGLGIICRDALQSLQGNFNGVVAPSNPVAYQLWADSSTGLMRVRDAANAAWVVVGNMAKPFLGMLHNSDFKKLDANSPVFNKTAANILTIKAGTMVAVSGVMLYWDVDTVITMPALQIGTDYAVYVCTDGTVRADNNLGTPAGYTATNSRKIGGFHYGLVPVGDSPIMGGYSLGLAGGYVNSVPQMAWTQSDVDAIAGINKFSIWDLAWKPSCTDPSGMALVAGQIWFDIYLCGSDTDSNGSSRFSSDIASGTVLPKIPASISGLGGQRYANLTYHEATIIAQSLKKRLPSVNEFCQAVYGVTDGIAIPFLASTFPITTRETTGYTSKYGIEQAHGHIWCLCSDLGIYGSKVMGGGRGTIGLPSYSRSVREIYDPSNSALYQIYPWNIGMRFCCAHTINI